MDPYHSYPNVAALSLAERVYFLKKSTLACIKQGMTRAELLQATEEAIEREQYELAQGIEAALQEFERNPQLALL